MVLNFAHKDNPVPEGLQHMNDEMLLGGCAYWLKYGSLLPAFIVRCEGEMQATVAVKIISKSAEGLYLLDPETGQNSRRAVNPACVLVTETTAENCRVGYQKRLESLTVVSGYITRSGKRVANHLRRRSRP